MGKGSALSGALREQSPAGTACTRGDPAGMGCRAGSGPSRQLLAAAGPAGVPSTPSRLGSPVRPALVSGSAGGGVWLPSRPCPAVLLGWAARHRAPYLCRRPASLLRGRRWPRGHGGRLASGAEPVRVLTSPPGALRVHPGALECSLRTCQIPGPPPLGPASHVLPWPELIAGRRPGPGERPGSGAHGCELRGCPGGLSAPRCRRPCHLARRGSAASPRPYATLPGWSEASGSVVGCGTASCLCPCRPEPGPPAWL